MVYVRKSVKKVSNKKYAKKRVTSRKPVSASVKKYVKTMISKTAEEKQSDEFQLDTSLCTLTTADVLNYNIFPINSIFTIGQGYAQNQRIGNEIILKKFNIKGIFTIIVDAATATNLLCGPAINVDLYIGNRKDMVAVDSVLSSFYQLGSTTASPTGTVLDTLSTVNTDAYNVYYHRRFKLGPSTVTLVSNNDYKLSQRFSIDLCKKHFKNKHLKYNDGNNVVQNADVAGLAMWCTFSDATGLPFNGYSIEFDRVSPYNLSYSLQAIYQDA